MDFFKLNEKQIEKWEINRAKGIKIHLIKWCLIWGSMMLILSLALFNYQYDQFPQLSNILIHLVSSFAGGIVIGAINWFTMEYGFKISVKDKIEEDYN